MDNGYQATLGIERPVDAEDVSSEEAGEPQRFPPPIQRDLDVRHRLQEAEQASRSVYSVLDRLSFGVVMLGSTGAPLHINASADAILLAADGLIRTHDGLRAANREDDRRLQALIGALRYPAGKSLSTGGHLRIRRPSGLAPYAVMLSPLGLRMPRDDGNGSAILIFVSDPGAKIVFDPAVLSELFGLPAAEGRLVLALLSGITPPEFARSAGISHNTARTLLARAMARTDTRSQLELVLLIAGAFAGKTAVGSGRKE